MNQRPQAFVYVLTAPDGRGIDYVKVGVTRDWRKRLGDLRHGLPFNVELMFVMALHTMTFARVVEGEILAAFKDKSTRGEWFMFESGQKGHMHLLSEGAFHANARGANAQWEPIDASKPITVPPQVPRPSKRQTARYRGGYVAAL